MKKYIIIAASLFFLAAVCLPVTYFRIDDMQDQVEIKETVLAGDAAAAAGTTLRYKVFNRQLLWDMEYKIGSQKKPKIRFRHVSVGGYNTEPVPESQAGFLTDLYGSSSSSGSIESMIDASAKPLVFDVAKRTKKGKTRKETHLLREYYEYFPARFSVDMHGVHIAPPDAPESYFKLPIPEDYEVRISITKNSRGDISAYSIDDAEDGLYSESSTASTCTDSGCYVALNPSSYYQAESDTSRDIPLPADMRGIHFVPFLSYGSGDDDKWFRPDLEHARLLYPLPEGTRTLALQKSSDGKSLYHLTKEKGGIYLSVIDIKSMKCQQTLSLPGKSASRELAVFEEDDDGNILMILSTGRFYLLTQKGKQIEIALSENLQSIDGLSGARPSEGTLSFDYDGRRLAMAFYNIYDIDSDSTSYLVLYDKGELQYAGCYESSLAPRDVAMEYAVTPAFAYTRGGQGLTAVDGIRVKLK